MYLHLSYFGNHSVHAKAWVKQMRSDWTTNIAVMLCANYTHQFGILALKDGLAGVALEFSPVAVCPSVMHTLSYRIWVTLDRWSRTLAQSTLIQSILIAVKQIMGEIDNAQLVRNFLRPNNENDFLCIRWNENSQPEQGKIRGPISKSLNTASQIGEVNCNPA